MPDFFPEGNTPEPGDGELRTLQKILSATILGGGGGGSGGLSGHGSPEGVVTANPGQTYIDVDSGVFYVKRTGSGTNTGWQ